MKLKNKIGNLIEIDWANDLHELQPDNVKIPINIEYLKNSILQHGFALPFAVWNDNGKCYCVDGHTRKQILLELMSDGVEVPAELKAFEILAKDRSEAIKILVEVYNQKHNPFAEEVLTEWLEVEEIELESLESVNVMSEEGKDLIEDFDDESDNYSKKIEAPTYEPSEVKPNFSDTYDKTKFDELIKEIENSSLEIEEKEFLKLTATRHIIFNYEKIADIYAHSDKQMQELMENSALVIIDFDKAIEKGFVKLSEEIANQYKEDYPDA